MPAVVMAVDAGQVLLTNESVVEPTLKIFSISTSSPAASAKRNRVSLFSGRARANSIGSMLWGLPLALITSRSASPGYCTCEGDMSVQQCRSGAGCHLRLHRDIHATAAVDTL